MRGFNRMLYIYYVLSKQGVDELLVALPWMRLTGLTRWLNPWRRQRTTPRGERIRVALESLGPIFVKFGQAMSTRPDLLPADIASALAQLQDRVLPFSGEEAVRLIEQSLGLPLSEAFASFDVEPLASASIAQVHAATLKDGRSVVVKVLRPRVHEDIRRDLTLMKRLARLLEKHRHTSRRFKPLALVEEFEMHLLDELNLKREAANAIQLRRNFQGSDALYVPEVILGYTRENVLVMERIDAIPISDQRRLKAARVDAKKLAVRGIEIFFTQVLRDAFFHADMHAGNIFVSKERPEDPSYVCVDFGVMGSLSETDQHYLASNLYAFFNRDYRRVAMLHIESGWVARETRVEVLESAIRTICEPIFALPLGEISFALVLLEFFHVAERFHMQVQPQLLLLQKTLFAVEGLGRQLYPDLDLWQTAKPFLEQWLKSRMGVKNWVQQMKMQWPFFIEQLPQLPKLLYQTLEMTQQQMQQSQPVVSGWQQKKWGWYFLIVIMIGGIEWSVLTTWIK